VAYGAHLAEVIGHLNHVLPGQAPILNFVHHNTLHGYQHLPFDEALAAAHRNTGVFGYLPESEFRTLYAAGRISDADLDVALQDVGLAADEVLFQLGALVWTRRDVFRVVLRHGVEAVSPSQLNWLIEVEDATTRFQEDVPDAARRRILEQAESEGTAFGKSAPDANAAAVQDLWKACFDVFELPDFQLHPEDLVELPVRLAESMLTEFRSRERAGDGAGAPTVASRTRLVAESHVSQLADQVGRELSIGGLVLALTGRDPLEDVRPAMARAAGAHLDEGVAAWNLPGRADGFYSAWRRHASADVAPAFSRLPDWQGRLASLPADALEAVARQLEWLGVPADRHEGYLRRVALEVPGWTGLVNWRQYQPGYRANRHAPTNLTDYLAVRLFLDSTWLEHVCRETWGIAGTWTSIRDYLLANVSEGFVRHYLFTARLPEYLASRARELVGRARPGAQLLQEWDELADMIWTWRLSPVAEKGEANTVYRSSWRLFRLAQHLGLSAGMLRRLAVSDIDRIFAAIDELDLAQRSRIWQAAYEHHYRDSLINALANTHGRGRWETRERRPRAQIVFCIDEREEAIRRHLEELDPEIETLGAAGFFGVVINWRGLDDHDVTPLCPIVATPVHEVREVPRASAAAAFASHERGLRLWHRATSAFQEMRRNLATAAAGMVVSAPVMLAAAATMVSWPTRYWRVLERVNARAVPGVPTEVAVTATDVQQTPTPDRNRLGFADPEQADRVGALLRNIGLVNGFAPLVVLMAHGSTSQNNPHEHAHDCGACSGRHGGPNARTFAAMANRPEVRRTLADRGMRIPDDTWFVGAQHNTCDEGVTYFDADLVPAALQERFSALCHDLETATYWSAHERCRRFASAPRNASLERSLDHVAERAYDFSQVRPEWGHATNASALVGRRSMSQGVFLDRRSFLISYDPTIDPDGTVLEGILLAVGPVGAGINLEYYFSTVDRERFGCGTKVPHNVTGMFAVMEGTSSDLRTGLPKQMTEIHEPVRLQIVIEASTAVLGAIYGRQAALRELIGNEWVHVISKDPATGVFSVFRPGKGFVEWAGPLRRLPTVARSVDYYRGETDPLAPVMVGETV
jgi:uncharacterized protein YbcC (UPF0753/DUF2309 family)